MPELQPSINESGGRPDFLCWLQGAIEKRISNAGKEGQREIDTLIHRALEPRCSFDRKHARLLYAIALLPDHVSWYLRLRERMHRLFHHH
jgi:hypothetical protein